jgi:hypothetical protein
MAVVTCAATSVAMSVPAGNQIIEWYLPTTADIKTDHVYFSPAADVPAGYGTVFSCSYTASANSAGPVFTIYYTLDPPSTTASARTWVVARGNCASGANVLLTACTSIYYNPLTPAMSYRLRVSVNNAANNATPTTGMYIRQLIYKL